MFSGSAAGPSCDCRFSHSPTMRCDRSAMSAIDLPTTDGSGILNPAASSVAGVGARRNGRGAFPAFLSFEAIETSFASATPAATHVAGSGERNQHMMVSDRGAQARRVKIPTQAVLRGSAMLLAVSSLLVGCSSTSSMNPVNWWHRQEGGKIAEQRPPPPGADQPFPNMATVPAKPETPDAEALKKLTASLVADRTNAQHAAQSAPLADPSSPTASPSLFGVGTAPPPPPPSVASPDNRVRLTGNSRWPARRCRR